MCKEKIQEARIWLDNTKYWWGFPHPQQNSTLTDKFRNNSYTLSCHNVKYKCTTKILPYCEIQNWQQAIVVTITQN